MIFTLIAIALLAAVAVIAWNFLRSQNQAEPTSICGHCGYSVVGLPTFTCPECGSDLRDVGIIPAKQSFFAPGWIKRNLPLLAVLLAWTFVYGAIYIFVGARSYPNKPEEVLNRPIDYGLIDAYWWPYQGQSLHTVTLEPQSGAYRRVIVSEERHAQFKGWRHAPMVNWNGDSPVQGLTRFSIVIQLDTSDAKTTHFNVDPASLGWDYADPENPKTVFNGKAAELPDAIRAWMMRSGANMADPRLADEAAVLADLVTKSATSGTIGGNKWAIGRLERIAASQRDAVADNISTYPFKFMRGSVRDSYGPAWSIYWLSIPFGLGIYSYGVNWIFALFQKPRNKTARQ